MVRLLDILIVRMTLGFPVTTQFLCGSVRKTSIWEMKTETCFRYTGMWRR